MDIRLRGKQNLYLNIVDEYKKLMLSVRSAGVKTSLLPRVADRIGGQSQYCGKGVFRFGGRGVYLHFAKKGAYADYTPDGARGQAEEVKKQLRNFRASGIGFDEILSLLKEVYGEEDLKTAENSRDRVETNAVEGRKGENVQ